MLLFGQKSAIKPLQAKQFLQSFGRPPSSDGVL
jgi:hypothetical protein